MKYQALNKLLGTYLIVIVVSVTLFVSPWNSIDPVNLPKLSLLGVLALISSALALSNLGFLKESKNRLVIGLSFLFIFQLSLVLIVSNSDFSFSFYGTPSRNTGFLAYLSLVCVLFASVVVSSQIMLKRFSMVLIGLGSILSTYGLAQSRGFDFWNYVNAYGSDVFGTFGNPNFQSAFMGIASSTAMTFVLLSRLDIKYKLGLFIISLLALANVALSSEQGNLNFLIGLSSALLIYLFSTRKTLIAWSFFGIVISGIFLVFLGIFNNGPLASAIYKSSLQARGFYWRAAVKMIVDHPFFGVGLDGFGDWYRRSRTQATAEFNAGIVADTAHNIPLDIGSGGGLPLLVLYFAFIALAILSIVRVVKRTREFNVTFAAIVAAWVAYQAQSFISINQLGIGIWGWSLTGLLIGYELNTRDLLTEHSEKVTKGKPQKVGKLSAETLLIAVVSGAIGLAVSLPPYFAANKYYKALQSGDGVQVQKAAYLKPYDRSRFLYSAQILVENKLDKQAIQILKDASKIYPDSFELWQKWSQIPSATPEQVAKAKAEMKRLDPFNPDLK